LTTQQVKLKI